MNSVLVDHFEQPSNFQIAKDFDQQRGTDEAVDSLVHLGVKRLIKGCMERLTDQDYTRVGRQGDLDQARLTDITGSGQLDEMIAETDDLYDKPEAKDFESLMDLKLQIYSELMVGEVLGELNALLSQPPELIERSTFSATSLARSFDSNEQRLRVPESDNPEISGFKRIFKSYLERQKKAN